jgi:hypothetical protein
MRIRSAVAAIPVAALLLAGCAAPTAQGGLSSEVVERLVTERADLLWETYLGSEVDRPEVQMVAYVPPDQLMARYVSCMHEAGYPEAHEYADGLSLGPAAGNGSDAYLALWVCTSQYPVHPALMGHLSAEQRGYLWDFWDARTVPCLRSLGFDVPHLGDRQAFVEAPGGYGFSPYATVDPGGLGWEGIDEACPPPLEDAFGTWHP